MTAPCAIEEYDARANSIQFPFPFMLYILLLIQSSFLLLFALFERACAIVALQHYSILTLEYQEEKRRC